MKQRIEQLVLSAILIFLATTVVHSQYAANRHVFGSGAVAVKNAQHRMVGTLGQPLIGVTKNQNSTNYVGFWYGMNSVPVGLTQQHVLPDKLQLGPNYPNPVAGHTTIPFSLGNSGYVRLSVVNILGEEMQTLVAEEMTPGAHTAHFNAAAFPDGVYFYRIHTGNNAVTRTFIIRK